MHEEQRKSEVKCRIEIVFQAIFNGKDCCFDTFFLLVKSKEMLIKNDNPIIFPFFVLNVKCNFRCSAQNIDILS